MICQIDCRTLEVVPSLFLTNLNGLPWESKLDQIENYNILSHLTLPLFTIKISYSHPLNFAF